MFKYYDLDIFKKNVKRQCKLGIIIAIRLEHIKRRIIIITIKLRFWQTIVSNKIKSKIKLIKIIIIAWRRIAINRILIKIDKIINDWIFYFIWNFLFNLTNKKNLTNISDRSS